MATAQTPVTTQHAWAVARDGAGDAYFDGDDAPSKPGAYNHAASLWASQIGGAADGQRVVLPVLTNSRNMLLKCFGDPASSAAGGGGSMRFGVGAIWAVAAIQGSGANPPVEYMGDFLGRFDVTVGNDQVGSSGILPSSPAPSMGRRATVRLDRAAYPGLRSVGVGGEASTLLVMDTAGCSYVIVELRCALPPDIASTGASTGAGSPSLVAATRLGVAYRFM
jgi:hypothetical protein